MTPEEKAEQLLRDCSENVERHVRAVADYAEELARRNDSDPELARLGGLLHDVGRCDTHDIDHVATGARRVRDATLGDSVARIVQRHVGAGLTEEEAERLGLPPGNYLPETMEEKIVAYADNRFSGDRKLGYEESLKRFREKVEDPDAVERYEELHREIRTH